MDCSCTGIGGLEASLKLNYVLVVPGEQAAMLRDELLARGVPKRQIYEVNPNMRPPLHCKSTNGKPAAAGAENGGGDRKRGRAKRFMPGAIKLGTYAAGGRRYTVGLRWGSVWISMVDRTPAADSEGASVGGGAASEGTRVASNSATAEVTRPATARVPKPDDNDVAARAPKEDNRVTMKVRTECSSRPPEAAGAKMTDRDGDCGDDDGDYDENDVDPNLGNDGRCNSSSTLCNDCRRWLLREYFGDRRRDSVSERNSRHACIYRRIVDRLFVVTVTESGDGEDGNNDDDDGGGGVFCCETATEADRTTSKFADPPERDQPTPETEHTTTPVAQPAPETEQTTTPAAPNVGKPKSKSFFGKLCSKSNKKTKNLEPPKTD